MNCLIRVGVSFLIVVAAYFVYCLAAVPLIEPPAEEVSPQPITDGIRDRAKEDRQLREQELAILFPNKNAWERNKPKILESDQVKLLVREYKNLGDGKVKIYPCTIIFSPDDRAGTIEQRAGRSVILEAPQGALLQFDEPLDLTRAKIGRLVSGRLQGPITIRSEGEKPGPEDNLLLKTHDVQMTESRVWTKEPVEFWYGPNRGQGQELEIRLLRGEDRENGKGHGPNIAGVQSFEVRRLRHLHLEFDDAPLVPGQQPPAGASTPSAATPSPIEVTCHGPFRFDPIAQLITLQDQVTVVQVHPGGDRDRIHCHRLSIYLARPRTAIKSLAEPEALAPKRPAMFDLQPRRVVAHGSPVVVDAPSREAFVQGERLEYDRWNDRILLEGSDGVLLRVANSEIHARRIDYQSGEPGTLGQVVADGPGWLKGHAKGQDEQSLHARWATKLQVRPDQGQQALSLLGAAELSYGAMGTLEAGQIHFWLLEKPPKPGSDQPQIEPDRMLALDNVTLRSPNLTGDVHELRVWFERDPGGKDKPLSPQPLVPVSSHQTSLESPHPIPAQWLVRRPAGRTTEVLTPTPRAKIDTRGAPSLLEPVRLPSPTGAARRAPASADRFSPLAADGTEVHLDITGGLLWAGLVIEDTGPELSQLRVEREVHVKVTDLAKPGEPPMVIQGNEIQVADALKPHAWVTVTGPQTQFQWSGLKVSATNLNLNRGTNQLWIDGAGEMELPLDRDLEGRPLPEPVAMVVRWQRQMVFDGHTVKFDKSVVATTLDARVETETLEIELDEPVRFNQPPKGRDPEPKELRCMGRVRMARQSFDQQGLASKEQVDVGNLRIQLISGKTTAAGPGWMTSVRRGFNAPPMPGRPAASQAAGDDSARDGFTYLKVRFQGAIEGNLHHRKMAFQNQVRCVYGRVDSWDSQLGLESPDDLGPDGVLLSCQQLSVTQMPVPTKSGSSVEMEASGNALVEGRQFIARAVRMTFDEAKDLLVLEGDGRVNAELFYEPFIGGPRSNATAQKIQYSPSRNHLHVFGSPSFEFQQAPRGKPEF